MEGTWDKSWHTVYPKKYARGFCFAVLCCGYTLTDFPISIRLTSLALWQSNDCPSASKATLMNMDKYFMWIHYERLHNHNKAKHNKTVCIFLGIYCSGNPWRPKRPVAQIPRNYFCWTFPFIYHDVDLHVEPSFTLVLIPFSHTRWNFIKRLAGKHICCPRSAKVSICT